MTRLSAPPSLIKPRQDTRPCYYPDGTLAPHDFPCTDDLGEETTCCRAGHACMSNGFCRSPEADTDEDQFPYIRGSCTDKNWTSSGCISICRLVVPDGPCNIADCLVDDRYCCAGNDYDSPHGACCRDLAKDQWFTTPLGATETIVGVSRTTTPTPSSSQTITSALSPTTTSPGESGAGISTSSSSSSPTVVVEQQSQPVNVLAIGLGAGLGGALFLICAVVVGICLGRKWAGERKRAAAQGAGGREDHGGGGYYHGHHAGGGGATEMDNKSPEVVQSQLQLTQQQPYVVNHIAELGPGHPSRH